MFSLESLFGGGGLGGAVSSLASTGLGAIGTAFLGPIGGTLGSLAGSLVGAVAGGGNPFGDTEAAFDKPISQLRQEGVPIAGDPIRGLRAPLLGGVIPGLRRGERAGVDPGRVTPGEIFPSGGLPVLAVGRNRRTGAAVLVSGGPERFGLGRSIAPPGTRSILDLAGKVPTSAVLDCEPVKRLVTSDAFGRKLGGFGSVKKKYFVDCVIPEEQAGRVAKPPVAPPVRDRRTGLLFDHQGIPDRRLTRRDLSGFQEQLRQPSSCPVCL